MNEYYNIAGINLKITGVSLASDEQFCPFICAPVENPDTVMSVVSEAIEADTGLDFIYSLRREVKWIKLDGGGTLLSFVGKDDDVCANALVSPNWKEIKIYVNENNAPENYLWRPVLSVLFYHVGLFHRSTAIHATAIKYNGGAIAFSAHSGTGKTTHADLWVNNFGAEYINGDTPLLKFINDGLYVCGSAWSGTAGIYKDLRVPMKSLVFLEQYPENIIEKLDPVQAMKRIFPLCLLPLYDRKMASLALDIIEDIVTRADCWLLKCTPDIEAAELARKFII
jgi:hypothetical protein